MDVVDRDMEQAEEQATRQYSGAWGQRAETRRRLSDAATRKERERREREERKRQRQLSRTTTNASSLSSSTDSSSSSDDERGGRGERGMDRIATATGVGMEMARTRTNHPIEIHRTETHRLQHSATVGASLKSRITNKPLPNFGGGKPFPPDLPPYEDYVVEFDGPDDPLHPQNWPFKRKLYIGAILAYTSLCSTFTSSLFSASTTAVAEVFGVGTVTATLSTSLYVLGYAFGPLIWGPFSELQGRKAPILVGMFGFTIFCFGCATSFNLQTLMLCRFFTGFFGSCPLAVVAAVFSDMFDNTQRGTAVVIFSSTVFLGPMMGPFIGGFIQASYLGWRWNLYIPGMMGALSFFLNLFLLRESYAPVVLVEKAAELRRITKNWGIHAKQEEIEVDLRELMTKNFTRPIRLLFTEPIILAVTLYMSFIYGLIYLFLTAYPLVFAGVHGFAPGISGLPFFGMVVGILIIASGIIFYESPRYNKKLAANGGVPIPEWRLPPVIMGGFFFTIGLFWFGWTGYTRSVPWIVPALSGIFTGIGLLAIFIQLFNYIIDSYLMFAASAIAANTFLRSIAAAGFPLFATQMFRGMGIQWAATLLGCCSAALIPIPVLFYFYGKNLRQKSKFAPTMKRKPEPTADSDSGSEPEQDMPALAATKSRAHESLSTTATRTNTRANRRTNTNSGIHTLNPVNSGDGTEVDLEKATSKAA